MGKLIRIAAVAATVGLAGCAPSHDGTGPSDQEAANAPHMAQARKDMADGLRCVNLLAAIAAAKDGPLRDQIERVGLNGIEAGFAERWEDRVMRDAQRGGLSAHEARRLIAERPAVVLDADELRDSAREAYDCAAAVDSSRGG